MKQKTYVIVNELDRPCTMLVAKIIEDDPALDHVKVRYLTAGTSVDTLYADRRRLTYVEDFGVELVFERGTVTAYQTGESSAAYPTGKPRFWQPDESETWALKPRK